MTYKEKEAAREKFLQATEGMIERSRERQRQMLDEALEIKQKQLQGVLQPAGEQKDQISILILKVELQLQRTLKKKLQKVRFRRWTKT